MPRKRRKVKVEDAVVAVTQEDSPVVEELPIVDLQNELFSIVASAPKIPDSVGSKQDVNAVLAQLNAQQQGFLRRLRGFSERLK
jgi:hypothetical protein